MHLRQIRRTPHYRLNHEKTFPWSQVLHEIAIAKERRKRGNRIEIKDGNVYILGYIENGTFYVINAKRK